MRVNKIRTKSLTIYDKTRNVHREPYCTIVYDEDYGDLTLYAYQTRRGISLMEAVNELLELDCLLVGERYVVFFMTELAVMTFMREYWDKKES